MIAVTALSLSLLSGFQGTEWGMSPAQVIFAQNLSPAARDWNSEHQSLFVDSTVAGAEATIVYAFLDKKLYRVTVLFEASHLNKNLYIEDYADMTRKMEKVYGEPEEVVADWKNDLYQGRREYYGMAIAAGHLVLRQTWREGDTAIAHVLWGDNLETNHGLDYASVPMLRRKLQRDDERLKEEL